MKMGSVWGIVNVEGFCVLREVVPFVLEGSMASGWVHQLDVCAVIKLSGLDYVPGVGFCLPALEEGGGGGGIVILENQKNVL